MSKNKVVIVGGGFGGIKAALILAESETFHVTLVSSHTDMWVYGALYHTATGGSRKVSSVPLSSIFAGKNVHVLHDEAISVDRKQKILTTKIGHTLSYDALILALGMRTNYFNIKGLKKYSFGIKSIEEAEELKSHIHEQLTTDTEQSLNYVVVGGGPTGVEIAGALPSYIRDVAERHGLQDKKIHIDLIEAAPRILPRMPKDVSIMVKRHLRKLGVRVYVKTSVQAQTADALMVNDRPIRSHTVIWTAGISNHAFFTKTNFQLSHNGKVRVDNFLQAEPGIFVIGDNADTAYSGMAQTALHDGLYVAENLIRLANNLEPRPYVAKKPIYVMPAGPRWAAVLWGKIRIYGFAGWILRRLADLIAYKDYEPWKMAVSRLLAATEQEDNCSICAKAEIKQNYLSGEI